MPTASPRRHGREVNRRPQALKYKLVSNQMTTSPVLIAGAGIGGLSVALTLHQIGVPCVVFESVADIKPLGLGINIQPNAIRELYELGFGPESLDTIGLQTREWALVGLNGNEVYSELRGLRAGYKWPQYSVHRGATADTPLSRCSGTSGRRFRSHGPESHRLSQSPGRKGRDGFVAKPRR